MIIRIKKQEHDVDIESKDTSVDHEDIVYVCIILIKKYKITNFNNLNI